MHRKSKQQRKKQARAPSVTPLMGAPTKKPPREARPHAAALFEVVAGNSDTKHHSRPRPEAQGSLQAPIRASQVKAQGRYLPTKTLSVTDGRVTLGTVTRHVDPRNGMRWVARTARGRVLGCYVTQNAAVARLAKAVRP